MTTNTNERPRTAQGNKLGRAAVREYKFAALSTDFGLKMLHQKFGEQAATFLAILGTYTRGPRKGKPRGYIHWTKVLEGGWDYSRERRGVLYRGTMDWLVSYNGDSSNVVHIEKAPQFVVIDTHPEGSDPELTEPMYAGELSAEGLEYPLAALERLRVGQQVNSRVTPNRAAKRIR